MSNSTVDLILLLVIGIGSLCLHIGARYLGGGMAEVRRGGLGIIGMVVLIAFWAVAILVAGDALDVALFVALGVAAVALAVTYQRRRVVFSPNAREQAERIANRRAGRVLIGVWLVIMVAIPMAIVVLTAGR